MASIHLVRWSLLKERHSASILWPSTPNCRLRRSCRSWIFFPISGNDNVPSILRSGCEDEVELEFSVRIKQSNASK